MLVIDDDDVVVVVVSKQKVSNFATYDQIQMWIFQEESHQRLGD